MKNLLFLTGLFPEEIRSELIKNSKSNTQFAADGLQWSFVEGMISYYRDFKVLNFPFLGSYPTLHTTTAVKQFSFGQELGFDGLNIGYFNFFGLKNFDIYYKAKKGIFDWARQNDGEKTILIYSAFLPFLKAAITAKREFKGLKILLIVTDMPEHMGGPDNMLYRIFKEYNRDTLQKCFNEVDGYILISKYMIEKLPTKNKKWIVIEGIANPKETSSFEKSNNTDKKIIHYTGTLARKSGILRLVEAFKLIKNNNYLLEICGNGNTREDIILAAENDKRIIYKGSKIDRPEILRLQSEASLLVSPRTSEDEFTKFSFPSKVMEYLASGTPTLLYKLPGIPDEYYDYCYVLENKAIDVFAEKIKEILESDAEVLAEKGRKAREFILNNKNPRAQCEKIYKLIEGQI